MAVSKGKTKKEENKVQYKEFKYSGKVFDWSGRVFPGREGHGKIRRSWGLTICLNDSFTLKGCRLVETDANVFITYPQYTKGEGKDAKFESYVFISKDLNEEVDAVVNVLMGVVGIDGEEIAKAHEKEEDMPF